MQIRRIEARGHTFYLFDPYATETLFAILIGALLESEQVPVQFHTIYLRIEFC